MLTTIGEKELSSSDPRSLSDELEKGRILFFPRCPLELPSPADLEFLRSELPALLDRKNVSYYPSSEELIGVAGTPRTRSRTHGILKTHSDRVQAFLRRKMPDFTAGWEVGTSSFRPLQEQGRDLKPHASNELVHVDAGAYGATHGGRIVRFFVNVHPTEDRVWATRGTLPELLERHGKAAGLVADRPLDLAERPWDRARSGFLRAVARVAPRAQVVDSSPYDRAMRKLHNYMKDDPTFRDGKDGYEEVRFPPFSAWAVLTDMVSHACLSGQYALVDTFVVPLERCHLADLAPFNVLQSARVRA